MYNRDYIYPIEVKYNRSQNRDSARQGKPVATGWALGAWDKIDKDVKDSDITSRGKYIYYTQHDTDYRIDTESYIVE